MSDELKPCEKQLCEGIAVIMRREMKKVYDTIDRHFKDFGIDYQFNAVEADLIPDATKDVDELLTLLRNTRTPDESLTRILKLAAWAYACRDLVCLREPIDALTPEDIALLKEISL